MISPSIATCLCRTISAGTMFCVVGMMRSAHQLGFDRGREFTGLASTGAIPQPTSVCVCARNQRARATQRAGWMTGEIAVPKAVLLNEALLNRSAAVRRCASACSPFAHSGAQRVQYANRLLGTVAVHVSQQRCNLPREPRTIASAGSRTRTNSRVPTAACTSFLCGERGPRSNPTAGRIGVDHCCARVGVVFAKEPGDELTHTPNFSYTRFST